MDPSTEHHRTSGQNLSHPTSNLYRDINHSKLLYSNPGQFNSCFLNDQKLKKKLIILKFDSPPSIPPLSYAKHDSISQCRPSDPFREDLWELLLLKFTASNKMASIVAPLIAILATLQLTASLPLEGARVNGEEMIPEVGTLAEQRHQFPWQVSGKYQGDIMLQVSDSARNGLIDSSARWANRMLVRWQPSRAPSTSSTRGLASDSALTSLPTGITSTLPEIPPDGQVVNLQLNGCVHHGVAVHELLHALGFFHQQSATERDDYVRILWNNIEPGMEHNFDKYAANQITNYNTIYDYLSIMHYDGYAFSFNGQPTIQSLRGNVQLGQIDTMTETDIIKLERMYGCRA
uniref:Metalloendopeptidase n=1 Tax=Timema poppense TaxID=170557 RepID=A0A7R9H0V5_TIMPO|nr:unnamed protein product [Timema poppensis]